MRIIILGFDSIVIWFYILPGLSDKEILSVGVAVFLLAITLAIFLSRN